MLRAKPLSSVSSSPHTEHSLTSHFVKGKKPDVVDDEDVLEVVVGLDGIVVDDEDEEEEEGSLV